MQIRSYCSHWKRGQLLICNMGSNPLTPVIMKHAFLKRKQRWNSWKDSATWLKFCVHVSLNLLSIWQTSAVSESDIIELSFPVITLDFIPAHPIKELFHFTIRNGLSGDIRYQIFLSHLLNCLSPGVLCIYVQNLTFLRQTIVISFDNEGLPVLSCRVNISYRMKIYTEFNLDTWLRLVKFTELNISKFWVLNSNYISYHWEILKFKYKWLVLKFSKFAISEKGHI